MNLGVFVVFVLLVIFWVLGVWYLLYGIFLKVTRRKTFVPFVPVDLVGLKNVTEQVPLENVTSIIDIGSGWGTAVFYLAKKFPLAHVFGVEIHPVLHILASIRKFFDFSKGRNIHFIRRDAAALKYGEYDCVFLFMLPSFMQGILIPKLEKELKKGAKVLCYGFPFFSSAFTITKIPVVSSRFWIKEAYLAIKK